MTDSEAVAGFLLTRQWRDTAAGVELTFWAASSRGPLRITVPNQEPVCFVARAAAGCEQAAGSRYDATPLDLRTLADGQPVDALYFASQRELSDFRARVRGRSLALHESDVRPPDRYLMERFITGGIEVVGPAAAVPARSGRAPYLRMHAPRVRPSDLRPSLRRLSIDVEASDLDGVLYSVAGSDGRAERVFLVDEAAVPPRAGPAVRSASGEGGGFVLERHRDEASALRAFLDWVASADPDVLIGWNVIGFDLAFLERRCRTHGLPFSLGRDREPAAVLPPRGTGQTHLARVPGRAVLDGIESLRGAFWSFEDWSLEAVGGELLGRGKLVHEGADQLEAIRELYRTDKERLAAYNLEDCRLVLEIFERTRLVEFCLERAQITGLALGRPGGSVAAFNHLYLPRLHRRGRVAPDPGSDPGRAPSPGGYVLKSLPGLYHDVLVLDFKSLYPSIIRTFKIDPYGLHAPGPDPVEGFLDAAFARREGILPDLMAELWARRDDAKRAADAPLSQAIKIIMNACYGVLASNGCRFYDPRLATSITRRGHEIIRRSRDWLEERGHRVIYGDTDSLFVLLDQGPSPEEAAGTGGKLAAALNRWWRETIAAEHGLESYLEVELETHYLRFLMPTVRGTEVGTKKRYAGLVRGPGGEMTLVFKGLETVRTDWTPLARTFQRELYRRIFLGEAYEAFVRETLSALLAGELDDQLVYRKRLRRPLHEYTKNAPPHVQAARKQRRPERWVSYIITRDGPEPVENTGARPDYQHYRERQLAPAADSILHFLHRSFASITDAQLAIF